MESIMPLAQPLKIICSG